MKREYRWTISVSADPAAVQTLAREINVSETIARVLFHRNITTYERAKEFFRPQLGNLHDPYIMDGMELAVSRVMMALKSKERVIVFGDYDVDGTNSAAMLFLFFKQIGLETMYHIPDRVKEGYG